MLSQSIKGLNNPKFNKTLYQFTLDKLFKIIYVYEFDKNNKIFIGCYPTVQCYKKFNMGYDTFKKVF